MSLRSYHKKLQLYPQSSGLFPYLIQTRLNSPHSHMGDDGLPRWIWLQETDRSPNNFTPAILKWRAWRLLSFYQPDLHQPPSLFLTSMNGLEKEVILSVSHYRNHVLLNNLWPNLNCFQGSCSFEINQVTSQVLLVCFPLKISWKSFVTLMWAM
jgi:hypothetical protein